MKTRVRIVTVVPGVRFAMLVWAEPMTTVRRYDTEKHFKPCLKHDSVLIDPSLSVA